MDCIVCDAAITGVVDALLKVNRCLGPKGVCRSAHNREGRVGILIDRDSKRRSWDEERPEPATAVADLLWVGLLAAMFRYKTSEGRNSEGVTTKQGGQDSR